MPFISHQILIITFLPWNSGFGVNIGDSWEDSHCFLNLFGISYHCIGVITPFKQQVKIIKRKLANVNISVSTVDKFQGSDKDIIILSLVRCHNVLIAKNDILNDVRRLNVSITRSKVKLIIIGNLETYIK
ncbi:hypothetical protein A3Q56_07643 [Intoshia linei]|uniref:DNA2/NAM7 helicase-like C-terminal domain-containing protein n=1 Tax=Intoshia linei TaxID=1819745 RepID=A0A177ASX3_9BILA|nr:hypothetical protein A3Q56_07643 [Intoshia linei]